MRILFINQYYAPDTAATGQLLADVAERLVSDGHEVHVLCSRALYNGGQSVQPRKQVLNGVHVRRINGIGAGRRSHTSRIIEYMNFFLGAFLHVTFTRRPDVCVCLTTPPFIGFIGLYLKFLKRTKLLIWLMDLYPDVAAAFGIISSKSIRFRVLRAANKWICKSANLILLPGKYMQNRLASLEIASERCKIIDHWTPQESVSYTPPQPNGPMNPRPMTLMYSGNLGMGQDLESMVDAMQHLGNSCDIEMLFVGNGHMRKRLEERVAEHGLENVSFSDPVPLNELSRSLARADIHLVSQREGSEGLIVPSKLYGILAAGRPVVCMAPERCEVTDMVREHEVGVMVKPGDVTGLAAAIERLSRDCGYRDTLADNARKVYSGHYGRDRGVREIVSTIEEI